MKKIYLFSLIFTFTLTGMQQVIAQRTANTKTDKVRSIIYFNPEVFPEIEEIKEPTYTAFYSAVAEAQGHFKNYKMLRVDSYVPYDAVDAKDIIEYCRNNNAELAVIPKVKYFKVGLGKYVFSNQVIISMKLYDSAGNFLTETDYDTYKKKARILGSAENSIKIGTTGAMDNMAKNLRKSKSYYLSTTE